MYHNLEVPDSCDALWHECQSLVPGFLKDCTIKSKDRRIDTQNPIDPRSKSIYLIKEGEIFETFDGNLSLFMKKGTW